MGVCTPFTSMFVALAGSELALGAGTTAAPTPPAPSSDRFLSPAIVQALVRELAADAFFRARERGGGGDARQTSRHCVAVLDASRAPPCGAFLVRCRLAVSEGPRHSGPGPVVHTRGRGPAGSGASRVPRWADWGALRAGQDGVAGSSPCLVGRAGPRRRRVCPHVPDVPAGESGARRPARPPPSPAASLTAGRDDWGGPDRRTADDGGRVRHDPESRRPAVGQGACSSNKGDGDGGPAADAAEIVRDMCLSALRRRLPGRAGGGP